MAQINYTPRNFVAWDITMACYYDVTFISYLQKLTSFALSMLDDENIG